AAPETCGNPPPGPLPFRDSNLWHATGSICKGGCMARKIVQITAIKIGASDHGMGVAVLDSRGDVWVSTASNVQEGADAWQAWQKLPSLPKDDHTDPIIE